MTTQWLDGYTRVPGVRDYGPPRRPDLPDFFLRHTPEANGWTAANTSHYIATQMSGKPRNCRVHFWISVGITNNLAYKAAEWGSKERVSDEPISSIEDFWKQLQPMDGVAWGLASARNKFRKRIKIKINGRKVICETNHAGLVIQTEVQGWAADMKHITDHELQAELPHWVRQCQARGIT